MTVIRLKPTKNPSPEAFFGGFDSTPIPLYNAEAMREIHDDTNEDIVRDAEAYEPQDDVELEETEEASGAKIKDLREKLKKSEEERRLAEENLLRTRADFLNSRRRLEEQLTRDRERAADKILEELLTIIDSFDTAMADKAKWESIDSTWRSGMEAIHAKLLAILRGYQVFPIDPSGQKFNPSEHEAVSNATVADASQVDTIIAVLQKGFKRGDTILRPARVIVGTKE